MRLCSASFKKRRQQPHGEQRDLLDMLMQVRYEDSGEAMGDQQIRDEVMSLLIAGHETTANTLGWLFGICWPSTRKLWRRLRLSWIWF